IAQRHPGVNHRMSGIDRHQPRAQGPLGIAPCALDRLGFDFGWPVQPRNLIAEFPAIDASLTDVAGHRTLPGALSRFRILATSSGPKVLVIGAAQEASSGRAEFAGSMRLSSRSAAMCSPTR